LTEFFDFKRFSVSRDGTHCITRSSFSLISTQGSEKIDGTITESLAKIRNRELAEGARGEGKI
jgi:hypothetical protein